MMINDNIKILFLNKRKIIITLIVLLCLYILVPLFFFKTLELDFYPYKLFVQSNFFICISFTVFGLLLVLIVFSFYGENLILPYDNKVIEKLNKLGLISSVFITLPLLYFFLTEGIPDNREAGYLIFENYRMNIAYVLVSNVYMISSIISAKEKKWRHFIFFILILCIPEFLLGSRITTFRLVVISLIVLDLWLKQIIVLIFIAISLLFSRVLVFEIGNEFNLLTMVSIFGEMMNTYLGANLVWQEWSSDFCYPIIAIARFVIPPFLRHTSEVFDDLTTCVNKGFFNQYDLMGLAGSPISDLVISPLVFVVALILFYLLIRFLITNKSTFKTISLLFFVSCLPYFMRWGLISTITFVISTLIWYIFPLIFFTKNIKTKKQ